jgi:hypothetical protein
MFSWKPGGSKAGEAVHFIWRIPLNPQDRDDNWAFRLQAECLTDITTYHTKVKKIVFYAEVVNQSFFLSKAVASAMYNSSRMIIYPVANARVKAMQT